MVCSEPATYILFPFRYGYDQSLKLIYEYGTTCVQGTSKIKCQPSIYKFSLMVESDISLVDMFRVFLLVAAP